MVGPARCAIATGLVFCVLTAACASFLLRPLTSTNAGDFEASELNEIDGVRGWTIAMYWGSDNDLDELTETYLEMWRESLANTDEVAICVFVDGLYDPASISTYTEEGWVERASLGEVNSSSPDTLESFVEYALTEPILAAENYMLIVQDHGLGYLGTVVDESEPVRSWMSIDGLGSAVRGALASAEADLDIIALDACTLAMVEIAYELRDTASFLVASQLAVPFDGLNYRALLSGLSEDPYIEPVDLACKMVADYGEWYSAPLGTYPTLYPYLQDFATLSVLDLSLISEVGDAFASLGDKLLPKDNSLGKTMKTAAMDAFIAMWMNNMGCGFYSDIVTMFGNVAAATEDSHPAVSEACDNLVEATRRAVVDSWASERFDGVPNGLSVFVCPSVGIFDVNWDTLGRAYDSVQLDFVDMSSWDEVLLAYFATLKQYGL